MGSFVIFILFCQALGAIIGTATVVWGELSYLRAIRDGRIDEGERKHLEMIARGLRFGMTLLLLASLALIFVAYASHDVMQPGLMSEYWLLVLGALLIVAVSWALSRKVISFALGSAVLFTAWWFLTYLTLGAFSVTSFGAVIGFFIVAIVIFYGVLQYIRMLSRPKA